MYRRSYDMVRFRKLGIRGIYRSLLERLPSTYPKPNLIVHHSLSELADRYWDGAEEPHTGDPGHPPFAFCDGDKQTIHIAAQLNREPVESIVWYYLHELGHLFALQRYGEHSDKFKKYKVAEKYANRFASRWVRRLKKERWL
jgi:Zn-dependent peptidase ImmA (M78 family)